MCVLREIQDLFSTSLYDFLLNFLISFLFLLFFSFYVSFAKGRKKKGEDREGKLQAAEAQEMVWLRKS